MRVIVSSLVALSASLWLGVQAATSVDSASSQQLVQLEQKYFDRTFKNDSEQSRTERLEQFVFGQTVSGDLPQRIQSLSATIPPAAATPADQTQSTESDADADSQLKGSARVASAASGPLQDYPRVTALENAILGKTFLQQPLVDRLSRMEKKAFGSVSKDDDLGARTDALEKYTEKKLHKSLFPDEDKRETASSGSQQSGSGSGNGAGSMITKSLLGMAAGTLLGVAGRGMMPGMYMPNLAGPGMGPGRSSSQRQLQQQVPATVMEDPAVFAAQPPPPQARLLVRVGWCEVHVFGNTFPGMHLEERLRQLNETLSFESGKSAIQLMDDVGIMIKAVQARNRAPQSIGNNQQTH